MTSTLVYRPEIDGLRAFAVACVILFHMNSKWLPGGFIGVDIFFVISGYLISTILLTKIHNKNFSLLTFYARRIKRILPPLYFVLIVTIITSYLLFLPKDINYLNQSVKSVIFFWGNIFFATSGDYFSLKSSEIPLLNMWSLAVEEQFYFLWPAICIFLFRFKKNILLFPFILTIISFFIAQYLLNIQNSLSFAYYSLVTRAGELLIGYLLAAVTYENNNLKFKNLSFYIEILGIFFIFSSILTLNKSLKFPGLNAFYPCLGTALLIYGLDNKKSIIYKVLTFRLWVFIGKLSYSLYLWHWPILAYMRYAYGSYALPLGWLVAATILMVFFSLISYIFIENKTRYLNWNFTLSFLSFYLMPTFIIFLLISFLSRTDWAQEEKLEPIYTQYAGTEICHGNLKNECIRGDKHKKPTALIVGDSHAAHYNYFFERLGQKYGWSAKVISSSSCVPVLNFNEFVLPEWAQEGCKNLKSYFWQHYKEVNTIILSARWDFHLGLSGSEGYDPDFLKKLETTFDQLSANVKHIYVFSQIPMLSNNPFRIKKFIRLGLPIIITTSVSNKANEVIKKLTAKYTNITWIDTTILFKSFHNGFLFNGKSVYMDDTHLNQYGAQILADLFFKDNLHLKIF